MGSWIGPAIVAAVIVGIFTVTGWFVTASLALRAEDRKRQHRSRDVRIALRAEIIGELSELETDPDLVEEEEEAVIQRSAASSSLFVPAATPSRIFEALISELPLLPVNAVEPVVFYTHQRDIANGMRSDLRRAEFGALPVEERARMVRDYLRVKRVQRDRARMAIDALGRQP